MVSGPDENDNYIDLREEYIYNEVTLDYNAGFQSAVAGLRQLELQQIGRKKSPKSYDLFSWILANASSSSLYVNK